MITKFPECHETVHASFLDYHDVLHYGLCTTMGGDDLCDVWIVFFSHDYIM